MKTKYSIEPRVKKRWFKKNKLYYDLVKTTEKGKYVYNGLDVDYVQYNEAEIIFSSKDINEVLTVMNNLKLHK